MKKLLFLLLLVGITFGQKNQPPQPIVPPFSATMCGPFLASADGSSGTSVSDATESVIGQGCSSVVVDQHADGWRVVYGVKTEVDIAN